MKKIIIFVLTILFLLTSILLTESVKAELTPITPVYGGDILNGKELYLFQNYSSTPNFENGYISKKTITSQDVYYLENSAFNGWYNDLGKTLIDDYTAPEHEPENPYFTFYIRFNNMLGQYLQLALIAPEPYVSTYKIKYKNENPITLLETNLYNQYLIFPPTGTNEKEIEWISYDVYYPDYLASFRPLTADIAYQFGFDSGETQGYNNGYNTGYTNGYDTGYTNGYNEGSIDTQYGVNTVVDFNQNAPALNSWSWAGLYGNFENNSLIVTSQSTAYPQIFTTVNANIGDIFYLTFRLETTDYSKIDSASIGFGSYFNFPVNENVVYIRRIVTYSNINTLTAYCYVNQVRDADFIISDVMAINLTKIYGSGNEPNNIDTILNDFPSTYYDYTTSKLINIDYENGYIKGQKLGYNLGYDDGVSTQATKQLTSTGWIQSVFGGISSLLNIQLFPGVTIGIIVGIPFIISLAYFVIRAFRGGGGA